MIGIVISVGLVIVLVQQLVLRSRQQQQAQQQSPQEEESQQQVDDAGERSLTDESSLDRDDDVQPASRTLPLAHFTQLQPALQAAPLIALYFAASWCPASTEASELIDAKLTPYLVPPPGVTLSHSRQEANGQQQEGMMIDPDAEEVPEQPEQQDSKQRVVALVYISSDEDEEEMGEYLVNRKLWWSIPFESPEKTQLKHHFKTCARIEIDRLGFERKHELPTLLLIDGPSQQVLSFHGVHDLQHEATGKAAIDQWQQLARLSNALEAKFAHTDDAETPHW